MDGYTVRPLGADEYGVLGDFLYEAIFISEGVSPPPREIINQPELQVYVEDFGTRRGDIAVCAEYGGRIVGAAWSRIMNDYGHIDDDTPSLAISLYKEHRGRGVGTELMRALLAELKSAGFGQVSLSVQKANYAVKLYRKTGFVTVDENDEEYIMLRALQND
ncbi:MAG: GNAT family N-acetyltransferase [Ruminococcus sp.]|nr:GNAT family N-acetyltransferase [Ruminococcus sp.]